MATNCCNKLERSRTHEQLLKACDPNSRGINTAAVSNGLTDDEVKEKKERYKDVAFPRAVLGDKCRFQEAGTCFYSHAANVIPKAKETPMLKAKAKVISGCSPYSHKEQAPSPTVLVGGLCPPRFPFLVGRSLVAR